MKTKTVVVVAVVVVVVVIGVLAVTVLPGVIAPGKKIRIAAVFPGDLTDQSFNQTGYESLMQLKTLGYDVTYVSGIYTPADAGIYFKSYAEEGYNIIWGHGFQFPEELARDAALYPNTYFVAGSGVMPANAPTNFNIIQDLAEEPGYVIAYVGANVSKTNKYGFIAAFDVADSAREKDGFIAGLEAARPGSSSNISQILTNDFHDVQAAKEAAISLAEGGADVEFFSGNGLTLGAVQGCAAKNVWAGTLGGDLRSLAPNNILVNAIWAWEGPLLEVIKDVESGNFKSTYPSYALTLKNGGFKILYNSAVPSTLVDQAKNIESQISSGQLKIPVRPGL